MLSLLQADDIRALLIDAMPPDALPSCLKPQATVVSVRTVKSETDDTKASQKLSQVISNAPVVTGTSMCHKPLPLRVSRCDMCTR